MSHLELAHRFRRVRLSAKTFAAAVGGVGVVALLALLAWGMIDQEPTTGRSGISRVGKPAPDFTLPVLGSDRVLTLSDYAGTPAVLNVWASWCPPCRVELPLLEAAWKEHQSRGVQFIGLDIQDSEAGALSTIERFGLTYPNVRDARGRSAVDYGVVGLPVTFFIDRDGIVVRRAVGALTPEGLSASLEALLAGETPADDVDLVNPEGFYNLDGSQG